MTVIWHDEVMLFCRQLYSEVSATSSCLLEIENASYYICHMTSKKMASVLFIFLYLLFHNVLFRVYYSCII